MDLTLINQNYVICWIISQWIVYLGNSKWRISNSETQMKYLALVIILHFIMSSKTQQIAKNVLGNTLKKCSKGNYKLTGWYRDGSCNTGPNDTGSHCICAIMTKEFLKFTKEQGNDLSTPRQPYFPGLEEGDRWCLCTFRWLEAHKQGVAPFVDLESTHENALKHVDLNTLLKYQFKEEK